MIELLQEILALCVKITQGSKADVFFSYEAHVNRHGVNYHENGWDSGEDMEWIALCVPNDEEGLTYTRNRLLELAEKLNVEI